MRVQKGRERRGRSAVRRTELGVARSEQTNEFGHRSKRERRFQASYDATSVPRCRLTLQADYKSATRFTGHYARSERPRTSRPIGCTSDRARRSTERANERVRIP